MFKSFPESISKNTSDKIEDANELLEINDVLLLRISFLHEVNIGLTSSFGRYIVLIG